MATLNRSGAGTHVFRRMYLGIGERRNEVAFSEPIGIGEEYEVDGRTYTAQMVKWVAKDGILERDLILETICRPESNMPGHP